MFKNILFSVNIRRFHNIKAYRAVCTLTNSWLFVAYCSFGALTCLWTVIDTLVIVIIKHIIAYWNKMNKKANVTIHIAYSFILKIVNFKRRTIRSDNNFQLLDLDEIIWRFRAIFSPKDNELTNPFTHSH